MEPTTTDAPAHAAHPDHHLDAGDDPALLAPLHYVRQGWQVIPVHYVGKDGCCTCKNPVSLPKTPNAT